MQISSPLKEPKLLSPLVLTTIIAGLLFKLLYLNHLAHGDLWQLAYPDEKNYYVAAAQEILAQGWHYFLTPRSLWNGPLNPLWIALWHINIPAIKIANIGLVILTSIFAWEISAAIFGARAALLTLILITFYPPFFDFGPTLLTEPLFTFLLIWSAREFLLNKRRDRARDLIAGVILGLATLTRPTVQFLPFLFLVPAVIAGLRNTAAASCQLLRARFAFLLVGFLILVAPYISKNIIAFNRPAIANGFGAVLYLGNDLRKNGDEPVYSEMDFDTYELTKPHTHLDTEGDKLLSAAALQTIKDFPLDIVLLTFKKAARLLFGYPRSYFYPFNDLFSFAKNQSILSLLFCLLTMTILVGSVVLGISYLTTEQLPSDARIFLSCSIFYFTALHSIAFAIPRMALPIFPFFAILAGGILVPTHSELKNIRIWGAAIASLLVMSWISFSQRHTNPNLVFDSYARYFKVLANIDVGQTQSSHDLEQVSSGNFRVTGPDPFLVFQIPTIGANTNQVVLIKMAAKGSSHAKNLACQIFWADSAQGFGEDRAKEFTIAADGQEHLYRISPSLSSSWKGRITQLRIDFPNHLLGLEYSLNSIELSK